MEKDILKNIHMLIQVFKRKISSKANKTGIRAHYIPN